MKNTDTQISDKEPMTIWISDYNSEKFEQKHLVRVNKIELINDHLMFYLGKELVFKVWLKKDKWQSYKNIKEALKDVNIEIA